MIARKALGRFVVATIVSILLMIVIANVVNQPLALPTGSHTADFTDVSGLRVGSDVRIRGVRAGKVNAIDLKRVNGQSLAQVRFTLDDRFNIGSDTRLAVKFQALTGLRYLDVADPAEGEAGYDDNRPVPLNMTTPSLDVTVLFNGLQPVLETLSPEEINKFTANAANFLSGDGSGLQPMLESVRNLSSLVAKRQNLIETLVGNMGDLSGDLRERSQYLAAIMEDAKVPVDGAMTILDEFRKSQIYGDAFTNSILRLLDGAGIKEGIDIDSALDRAFTNLYDSIEAFKLIPVIWENIPPPGTPGTAVQCSDSPLVMPVPMDVLLNGRKVLACSR